VILFLFYRIAQFSKLASFSLSALRWLRLTGILISSSNSASFPLTIETTEPSSTTEVAESTETTKIIPIPNQSSHIITTQPSILPSQPEVTAQTSTKYKQSNLVTGDDPPVSQVEDRSKRSLPKTGEETGYYIIGVFFLLFVGIMILLRKTLNDHN
jgi:LPXTG-motif cell wall-anchored protein